MQLGLQQLEVNLAPFSVHLRRHWIVKYLASENVPCIPSIALIASTMDALISLSNA